MLFLNLYKHIESGTLENAVIGINCKVPVDRMKSRKLFVMLTFITHAYIRTTKYSCIPESLAIPLFSCASNLSLRPTISYASTVQFNILPFDADCLDCDLQMFGTVTDGEDEEWFYKCSAFIERLAPSFIEKCFMFFKSIECNDFVSANFHLHYLSDVVVSFKIKLERVRERCLPFLFNSCIRFYLQGCDMAYGNFGQFCFAGANAGQSPFIQLVDIVCGIKHDDQFPMNMRQYMADCDFKVLQYFEKLPSIRELIMKSRDPSNARVNLIE